MDFYDKNIYLYGNNFGRGGELIYDSLGYAAPEKVKKMSLKRGGLPFRKKQSVITLEIMPLLI